MSNINYQALRMAAENATPGEWCSDNYYGVIADAGLNANYYIASCSGPDNRANKRFIAAANPAAVLALLDELEYYKSREERVTKLVMDNSTSWDALYKKLEAAEKRIAELEARETKPAKGEVLVVVSGFTGCGKSAIAGEIEIAMKAIGVPVKWTNGDAEKRMTGADWLTAIEMYKPTVRIVEVNVPRVAGIRIKGGE
ncbi:ead/Ea22-like family protein [Escherichia coli]|uniref:Ead/Ea22-like family protein n=1 Tax=Escherichia coli TaxID=562 RepID=A0A162QYE9_ECOLX|nr:ead/Ea22-like family protein [Escherichia coli]EEW5971666.1 ead/Ea22-like family protein [Escherichia coli]EFA3500249.1 ead/Ea22-like family protein [Escherichia coli]EFA9199967.1 ead/Ea22-like family protein [Escherichia coli]EFB2483207.1 ead/Ea22-like family protein [Escherichia coli]EFB9698150.1 ead/Ea22-like family protein [Escherichia coli]